MRAAASSVRFAAALGLLVGCDTGAPAETESELQRQRSPAPCTAVGRGAERYLFCSERVSFDRAIEICEAAGLALATIDDAAENDFVASHVTPGSYIGLTDRGREGAWRWQADDRSTWCGTDRGRPEHVGAFTRWAPQAPSALSCELRMFEGHDYWFCSDRLSRADALRACEQAGAQVATATTAAESAFLAQGDRAEGFICEAISAPDPEQPDIADCAVVQAGGQWINGDCATPRGYVCETPPPNAALSFSDIASRVRDDFRTGRRLVDYAEISGEITAPELFARFPEALGMRACVDGFAAVGDPHPVGNGLEAQPYEQTYRGISVFTRGYSVRRDPRTHSVRRIIGPAAHNIAVDIHPAVTEHAAYRAVEAAIGPLSGAPPRARLILYPIGAGTAPVWRLAWLFDVPRAATQRDAYTVVVGADTPDVLMQVGETES